MRPISRPSLTTTKVGVKAPDTCEISGQGTVAIDAAERRGLAFVSFSIDRRDLGVKARAPDAARAFEHDEFCGAHAVGCARKHERGG
jgi:hypothetical protein